ncbi:putative PH-like domain superfamily protein [Plasmopara halstedii]
MEEPENMRKLRGSRRQRRHNLSTNNLQDEGDLQSASCMEGMLKKRLAKMPVMRDRYCVATWEMDVRGRKCVILRSFKSRKAYDVHPEKPSNIYEIKCISDWDGKTGFHRYQHAFAIETRDQKLFQCVAPSAVDKNKWVELMKNQSTLQSRRGKRVVNNGNLVTLQRSQSVVSSSYSGKPRTYSNGSVGKTRCESTADADLSTDSEDQAKLSSHDRLFRTTSRESITSSELHHGDKSEPADWGLYGETDDEIKSKYEVMNDVKPVLLENELLNAHGDTRTLASDDFLFEEAGASRFGAVVVKEATESDDDDDAEFIDEKFAAREAQKENEKKMKRRAQKLESNRDLYAEMAAARLASMRKDARHSKKSHISNRLSVVSDDSDVNEYDEDQSMVVEGEEIVHVEDISRRHSSHTVKSRRKSIASSSENSDSADGRDVGIVVLEEGEVEVKSVDDLHATESEIDELRLQRKKIRAERRAKRRLLKEKEKEKEEEERTTMAVAELARAHREKQRLREVVKTREEQEKRSKKERRDFKEKLQREKAKQRQAEAELKKLLEINQAEEDRRERERQDRKNSKKSKKKEKYFSLAERIHKKEERDAQRLDESAVVAGVETEVSHALVVVEKPAEPKPANKLPSASKVTLQQLSPSVQTEASPELHSAPAPAFLPAATPASTSTSNLATQGAGQAIPMYHVVPPPFVPTYPAGLQSMPAYGLAATFGAYPPFYTAPYSYGGPVGLQSLFPNMGFMAGHSAMKSYGKPAGPQAAQASQDSAKPIVGPQLPTPEERAAAGVNAHSVPTKLINLPELPDVIEF